MGYRVQCPRCGGDGFTEINKKMVKCPDCVRGEMIVGYGILHTEQP